jgi:CMP-N-acetylneuraminic acid synthetase
VHVTAIIPAKGTSERLPGKNLRPFPGDGLDGRPGTSLLTHKIAQLLSCERIDAVVVGSDDPKTLREARLAGALTRERDPRFCDELNTPLRERWRDLVSKVQTDLIVWAHVTNPLCPPQAYDLAVDRYLAASGGGVYDSLASVTRIRRHAWVDGAPFGFNPWEGDHTFARDLTPIDFQDGAIFIQPRQQMLDNGYFYGERPLLFELPQPYGWDVDTEYDLYCARCFYAMIKELEPPFAELEAGGGA